MAVLYPSVKSGDLNALSTVLEELDIDFDTDSLTQQQWVKVNSNPDANTLVAEDINIKDELVPNVVGMGAKDAIYLLESKGLRVNINGMGRVSSQSILPGRRIVKGQTISLILR